MGLHLCYELAVPRDTSIAEVVERMQRLYREAVTLPFETVGPLVRVTAGESLGNASEAESSLAQWFRFCARIGLDPRDPVTGARTDRLPDAVGFVVKPGDYCEAATFGLAWVPPSNDDGDRLHDEPYTWHWHAPALGFDVTVRDETHYWETRDTGRLLAEVREMNRIVAHFAGALNDAISEQAHVGGAIFEHREFEELETRDTDLR
jgi:hypothetical protein